MKRVTALLLVFSAPASAQNTTCFVNGQWVTCNTQAPSGVNISPTDFLGGMGGVQNLPNPVRDDQKAQELELQRLLVEQQRLQNNQAASANVQPTPGPPQQLRSAWARLADLIKEHRCTEAIDLAIREGGTEAGLRTKALCQ